MEKGGHVDDYPTLERDLVELAREGQLKGLVVKPPRYSASTIQNFADCQRKYYWPTLAALTDPASPEQAFGTELHLHQENYLKTGKLPPPTKAGELAKLGHHLLPRPMTEGMRVEENFSVRFPGVSVEVTGQIDLSIDPTEIDAKGFMLGDHKTAKSIRYPKTKEWLTENIQSNLYAKVRADFLRKMGFTSLSVVDKKWFYYFKTEKRVDVLRVVQSLDDVEERFETYIQPLIVGMSDMVNEAPSINDVPRAPEEVCEMYRGCVHRARCFGMGAAGAQSKFSKATVAAKITTTATQKGSQEMGAVAGKFSKQSIAGKVQVGAGSAINPPKPKPMGPPKKMAPPPPLDESDDEEAFEAAEEAAQEEEQVEEEEEAAPAPAPKAKPKAVAKKAPAEDDDEAPSPRKPGRASPVTPGANPQHDFWLFVGCGPTRGFDGAPVDIEQLLGAAQADGASRNGKDHYREGSSYGLLEACFAKWLEENPLVGLVVVSDATTLAARDVIGLLRAHATTVIDARR